MTGLSYKRNQPEGAWDAIVIGSGMGGLTTAALLARRAKQRVLVLERHYTAGGFTHVFKRKGYEWDVGVHYIGGIHTGIGALFDEVTGGHTTWAPLPSCYDRIILGDDAHDLVRGNRRFVETLSERFPNERSAIVEYLETSKRAASTGGPYFVSKLLGGSVGDAVGSVLSAPFHHYSDRTVEEVLRPIVRNPRLFDVLTGQCGDYGLTPSRGSFGIHAMVASHYIGGAHYPVGGPGTIAVGAERVIAAAGGEVYTNAQVERVLLEGGRAVGVEMADGNVFRAPVVISDAGVPNTLFSLLSRGAAESTGLVDRVRRLGPSIAHLCLHLGFEKSDEELGLDGTNLWVYAEGDREEAFRRFAANPDAEIPVAYMSFPSAKDPTFQARYPGKATVEVITLAQMDWFRSWAETRWMKRGDEYEVFKQRLTERLLEKLYAQRPQLRGQVAYQELSTPLSTQHFTAHANGEMYGLDHTPARFRLPLKPRSGIPGLYFTGADVVSCGVAGALFGGVLSFGAVVADRLPSMLRRQLRPRVTKAKSSPAPARQPRVTA